MEKKPLPELDRICAAFDCPGDWVSSCPIPSGHINDTYCSEFDDDGRRVKYVNQRINHLVFREPERLMENIERVTGFARAQIAAAGGDPDRESLTIVPTRDGRSFHRTPEGNYWRMYPLHRRRENLRPRRGPPPRLLGRQGLREFPEDAGPPARRAAARDDPRLPPHPQALRRVPRVGRVRPGPAGRGGQARDRFRPGPREGHRGRRRRARARASSPSGSPTTTPSSTTS